MLVYTNKIEKAIEQGVHLSIEEKKDGEEIDYTIEPFAGASTTELNKEYLALAEQLFTYWLAICQNFKKQAEFKE